MGIGVIVAKYYIPGMQHLDCALVTHLGFQFRVPLKVEITHLHTSPSRRRMFPPSTA